MPLPSEFNTVRVFGTYVDLQGNPVSGYITFRPTVQRVLSSGDTNTAVLSATITAPLDRTTGSFTVDLPATDDPNVTPDEWAYQVHEHFVGYSIRAFTMLAPLGEPIDLTTVVKVDDPPTAVITSPYVRSLDGQSGALSTEALGLLNHQDLDWASVAAHGATGDGITDDTAAIQAAADAAAGGTLYLPEGTYRTTDTLHLRVPTSIRFAGRGAVLQYTGTGSAIQATTFKGCTIDGAGTIDLSAAGDTAVGIHLAGIWNATVSDMKVLQGPPNSTGILIETGEPGDSFYFGAFCITLNNIDLLDGAGAYGLRAKKTDADPSEINSVTHLIVNNGWSKGKHTGLHLSFTSTVFINGYCVDTGYDGYYIEKSAGVLLKPGELGPVDHWAITFGTTPQEVQNIAILTPPYVGVRGATQLGYLDTSLIQPTVFDMSTMALRGSAGGDVDSELYYSVIESLYDYDKSLAWRVRGGGAEQQLMSWSEAGGLVIDGGTRTTLNTDLDVLGSVSSNATRYVDATVPLVDQDPITTDCSQGGTFAVTLGGDREIDTPANAVDGQRIRYRITQDATGGRTVTWSALFRFGTTYPQPTLSTAPGATDYIEFVWNLAGNQFDCLGYALGF